MNFTPTNNYILNERVNRFWKRLQILGTFAGTFAGENIQNQQKINHPFLYICLHNNLKTYYTMNKSRITLLGPYIILTFCFFIVGFMATVNDQSLGPLRTVLLEHAGRFKNTYAELISCCFFTGFTISALMSSKWINRYGYKTPLMRGLVLMVVALLTSTLSSWVAENYGHIVVHISDGQIPIGFFIFILGSLLTGAAAAMMQTVILPYVAAYEIPNTSVVQRVNITSAANSVGTSIAPFFVTLVIFRGVKFEDANPGSIMLPYICIAICVALTRVIIGRLSLPDIKDTRIDENDANRRNIWSFRHLVLGLVAIFCYVGAEMSVGINVNLHAMDLLKHGDTLSFLGKDHLVVGGLNLGIPALLATIYWSCMMIGRILSGIFLKNVCPKIQLYVATTLAITLTMITVITNNLWVLVFVGLCHSLMWSSIFTLAITGLKKYTSRASGIFMLGCFGGAVFPMLQGILADTLRSWQYTWLIVIACELVILSYALIGSRIREKDRVEA